MVAKTSPHNTTIRSLNDGPFQICIATKPWEKKEIYKLRYEVFVQEMAKSLGSIVHKRKELFDPLDDHSILFYVQTRGEIIATVRLTIATPEDYPITLSQIFKMDKFRSILPDYVVPRFGLSTKFAIRMEYRNTPVAYLILAELYRIFCEENIQFGFGGCNPYLIPFYERIGFRRFAQNFTDPGYGLLVPIVMIIEDQEHLKAVKSPLYRQARKKAHNAEISRRFFQAFPEALDHINTRLTTPDSLWSYIESRLNGSPLILPLFRDLTKEFAMDLISSGIIFPCELGDYIIQDSNVCNDLYILLSGTLGEKMSVGLRILRPGEHFGNLTQAECSTKSSTISALTSCELLVIPRQSFERYKQLHPEAAEIIMRNFRCQQGLNIGTIKQGGQAHE